MRYPSPSQGSFQDEQSWNTIMHIWRWDKMRHVSRSMEFTQLYHLPHMCEIRGKKKTWRTLQISLLFIKQWSGVEWSVKFIVINNYVSGRVKYHSIYQEQAIYLDLKGLSSFTILSHIPCHYPGTFYMGRIYSVSCLTWESHIVHAWYLICKKNRTCD